MLLIADAGYSPYQTTIAISRKLAEEKKDLVQRFVDATLEGWAQYLKGGPAIEAANALIKQANPEQTDDRIAYAIKVLNERGIVMSGDALQGGIGAMTRRALEGASTTRWWRSACCRRGSTSRAAHTLEFVNKGIGKA